MTLELLGLSSSSRKGSPDLNLASPDQSMDDSHGFGSKPRQLGIAGF